MSRVVVVVISESYLLQSKVKCTADVLMRLFFLLHVLFETLHALLQISVDLQVSLYYSLHSVHVLVHVVLLVSESLKIADKLALFC